jgi:hypothetical protein
MLCGDGTHPAGRVSRAQSARRRRPRIAPPPPVDDRYGVGGVLASRSRFHLVYRLMVRLNQVADPAGGARTRRWRRLLAASAAADVALAVWLRLSTKPNLGPRLALDAVDTATWSLAPYPEGYWDYAVLPDVPLCVEVGLGLRWRGMILPAVSAAVTTAVRTARRQPVQLAPFTWQVLAVAGGAGFHQYNQRVRADALRTAERMLAAREAGATLAGQNAVAMGADTVIDQVQSIAPLFGRPMPGSALYQLVDGWKTALAEATQRSAAYLGTVLIAWQRGHNTHPDLSRRVDFAVTEGHGTVLLTGPQARALQEALDRLDLRGELPVRVRDDHLERRTPGRRIDVVIGDRLVAVPPDTEVAPRSPDFGPIGLLLGAVMYARMAMPTAERVPLRVVAPLMASTIAAAGVAEHRLRRRGSAAQGEIQLVGLAISAMATALATRTARLPFKPSGGQNFPFYSTLSVPMVVYAFQHQDLSPRMRRIIPIGFAAIAATGWVLAPRPRQFGQCLLALTWPLAGLISGLRVSIASREDARRLADTLHATEQAAVDAAYARGTTSVIRLARAAYTDARDQLEAYRAKLDPDLIRIAEQRLNEVHRCLDQLTAATESPSSTTTRSASTATSSP